MDERTLRMLRPVGCGPYRSLDTPRTRSSWSASPATTRPTIPYTDRLVFDYSAATEEELPGAT